jgi:hypothetical protein
MSDELFPEGAALIFGGTGGVGQGGRPEGFGHAAVPLASNKVSYITG